MLLLKYVVAHKMPCVQGMALSAPRAVTASSVCPVGCGQFLCGAASLCVYLGQKHLF